MRRDFAIMESWMGKVIITAYVATAVYFAFKWGGVLNPFQVLVLDYLASAIVINYGSFTKSELAR